MPDHIHLLLSFPDIPSYSRKIGDWKHYLSHFHGVVWQENFFDHRLRDQENFGQKSDYILYNPVRAGLVQDAKDWPYVWMPGRD
jgi:REP element-mobilizing transposase RayT